MTVTTYAGWLAAGSPWKPSNPSTALANACHAHGVSYGIIGNTSHFTAHPPEDHCPFSNTPWPGAQPYPYVLAVDLMTTRLDVANRIITAKRSGRLPCLKYINWTDSAGRVWHTSWQPNESTKSSTDSGHIHCSWRTDHVLCNHATGFDPFIDQGDDMPLTQADAVLVAAEVRKDLGGGAGSLTIDQLSGHIETGTDPRNGASTGAPSLKAILDAVTSLAMPVDVDALAAKVAAALIASNANGLTPADHAAVVEDVRDALRTGTGA